MFHLPWPEGVEPAAIVKDTISEVVLAEELGFSSAWLAEHHFSRYGIASSSMVVASAIAARTSKIRLGTSVLVPPLHDPIRLAEDTATVDVISNGRLDVGFGRGSAAYEYDGFTISRDGSQERFQEAIAVIKGLWTTPEYTHKGEYYSVNRATLVPPPVQKPHPPIFIAATRTQTTLDFAASTGSPTMVGVTMNNTNAEELLNRYKEALKRAGKSIPLSEVPFFRYFYVAETEEKAREDTMASINWAVDMVQWRGTFAEGSEVTHRIADWRKARTSLPDSYDFVCENRAVIGTPDQVAAKIQEYRDSGIEYFGCNFAFGGMDHDKVMRSMKLFHKEVMPRFR
jgi:alkanesulfonate monooxygenase SsuD/methylene tetrahydromethanopterin reductase-like flavin-dependent oxidoreductase (luciferase family)